MFLIHLPYPVSCKKKKNYFWFTAFYGLLNISFSCVVAGSGILAIAHALSQSGWIGLVFLFLSACMSQFTGIILIKCLYTEK
jgi:hypothetical protein